MSEQTSQVPKPVQSIRRGADLSDCETYRYDLTREWNADLPKVVWIMLNPSTADHRVDDRTICRCMGFARAWGFGGIRVRNLYALRATDPAELRHHADPIGPLNDRYLDGLAAGWLVVCAWGAHGLERGITVSRRLRRAGANLAALDFTKDGAPRHPLYLKSDTALQPWEGAQLT